MNSTWTEIKHHYGQNVHILNDRCLNTWLSRLCSPETFQPLINQTVVSLYGGLMRTVLDREFPMREVRMPTRMTAAYPDCPYEGVVAESQQRAVTVNLARAGTLPSQVCYDFLNYILNPQLVRQDHILASRTTDQQEKVTGTHLGGAKIGGDIAGAIVLFPDPMGATGNTLVSALDHYKKNVGGKAAKFIALHLIVTPEYLKNVAKHHPDLVVYAVRVDRGLSPMEVLKSEPGKFWEQEKGLNEKQYIVPGGGGLGEIMNNSFV